MDYEDGGETYVCNECLARSDSDKWELVDGPTGDELECPICGAAHPLDEE